MSDTLTLEQIKLQRRLTGYCKCGDIGGVRAVLAEGADINGPDGSGSKTQPFDWAARRGHYLVVQYLLDAGADVDTPLKATGHNRRKVGMALREALGRGDRQMVLLLVQKGISFTAATTVGRLKRF